MRAARASGATIRLLREGEIPAAEQIYREAFSAHLGIPDPSDFTPGAELIGFRWRKDPARVYAAERDGELVGSNVATNWGSVGVFGPLTVRPELWNAGIGRQLVDAAVTGLEDSGCRHLVLFTFAESAKHVALYQRYGYWPRFLTAIAARSVEEPSLARGSCVGYATVPPAGRRELLAGCRDLTEAVYGGLDLSPEIESLAAQRAGETIVLNGSAGVDAFALCHVGPGSEASTGTAFVKFAAARPGRGAGERFDRLLAACEEYAATRGASTLVAGLNLARERAARILTARDYRVVFHGVAMHRPNTAAYDRPDRYVIDDWR
jgi:predicted N-acetyltransferase YhbS